VREEGGGKKSDDRMARGTPFVCRPLCYYVKRDDHFSFSRNNGSVFFNALLNGQYLFSRWLSGNFSEGCSIWSEMCGAADRRKALVADRVNASLLFEIFVLHHVRGIF
jgi:hypothetical protein